MNKIQIGEVFGRLTVVEAIARRQRGNIMWLCRCVCGNTKLVSTNRLRGGFTRSCGCLRKAQGTKMGTSYGSRNQRKLYLRTGVRRSHRKAGGTVKVKAMLNRLGL